MQKCPERRPTVVAAYRLPHRSVVRRFALSASPPVVDDYYLVNLVSW